MATKYKVSLFSLDGTQFLRKVVITVPSAQTNGGGTPSGTTGQQTSAATVIGYINNRANGTNIYFSEDCQIFVGKGRNNNDDIKMGSFGFNVLDPVAWAGPGVRIVFSNGSYIKFTPATVVGQQRVGVDFCLSNDNVVTSGFVNAGIAAGASDANYYQQCSTLPMVLRNIDGTITDWTARWGGPGIWQYRNDNNRWCYASNGTPNCGQISNVSLQQWYEGIHPVDEDNPYEDAGTSGEDGGGGNFSEDSDDVEEDLMPTLSAVGTGFATLFTPSQAQLKNLADIMWGSQWWQALQNEVQGIDKMFVSLGVVPFIVTPGSTVEVTWLGLSVTEVFLTLATAQYYEFDMGTIDLSNDSRIWNSKSAMDYGPFSKLGIYLPFIGFQELDIDECRDATVQLKYRIDALTGSVVALVKIAGNTIYQFTGNCMTQIPITSQSYDELFSTVTNVAIAGSNVKTAGALAGGGDNVAAEAYTREKNPITEAQGKYQVMQHAAQVSHAENSLASATANAISGLKPNYNKTGAVSASNSLFCVKQPYLFLTTPRVCIPERLQKYGGFPANITDTLENFEGFTVVNNIRLNDLVATSPEIQEIYDLLHEGVII